MLCVNDFSQLLPIDHLLVYIHRNITNELIRSRQHIIANNLCNNRTPAKQQLKHQCYRNILSKHKIIKQCSSINRDTEQQSNMILLEIYILLHHITSN